MSVFTGKFGEVRVLLYLLSKGYEVYTPIVDTGIDFVIEPPSPAPHKFVGVQVRTSSYQPKSDWWMWSVYKDERRKRSPFFYILCCNDIDKLPENVRRKAESNIFCFVVPYDELDKWLKQRSDAWNKKGEFSLSINRQSFETGRSEWLSLLNPYLNDWGILK